MYLEKEMNTTPGTANAKILEVVPVQWYALHVRCNQEKNVAQSLNTRGIEHFLPCYESRRQWKDRRVTLEMPLFPGYLFVRVSLFERSKAVLMPNVISMVGAGGIPSAVDDEEIASIKRGLEHGTIEPHEHLRAGEQVIFIQGAMSGMHGILLRRQNGMRVVVSLDSISRAFSVEVDEDCIMAVNRRLV